MAEQRVIAPEIKVLIGIGAAILTLMVLTLTFFAGFYVGRLTDRGSLPYQMGLGGATQQGLGQGGAGQPRNRIQELGGTVVRGQVKSISGNTLTVTTREGGEKKVVLASDATVQSGQNPATVSDIKEGDRIIAVGKLANDGSLEAKAVRIVTGQAGVGGPGPGSSTGPGGPAGPNI